MDKQVAGQALAVVREAAPAKKADGVEWPFGRIPEKRGPVDGLLAGVRWNGVDPGPAGRVAVPIGFDLKHVTQLSRVGDLLGFGIEDRTHPLAADLNHAAGLVCSIDHG